MAGAPFPWWVAGGWAIEAFTGRPRAHEDTDVALFRDALPAVLGHLLPNYCVWSNQSGSLRPLREPDELPEDCRQLWVRRDAASPWLFDLLLTPHELGTWVSVRDARVRRDYAGAVFVADGVRYLRPELVLHLKAKLGRTKDDEDFRTVLPSLDAEARAWLRSALELANRDHPWLNQLDP